MAVITNVAFPRDYDHRKKTVHALVKCSAKAWTVVDLTRNGQMLER